MPPPRGGQRGPITCSYTTMDLTALTTPVAPPLGGGQRGVVRGSPQGNLHDSQGALRSPAGALGGPRFLMIFNDFPKRRGGAWDRNFVFFIGFQGVTWAPDEDSRVPPGPLGYHRPPGAQPKFHKYGNSGAYSRGPGVSNPINPMNFVNCGGHLVII